MHPAICSLVKDWSRPSRILLLVFLQTGALTLMTLMLTGVVKGGIVDMADYEKFIDKVQHTSNESTT